MRFYYKDFQGISQVGYEANANVIDSTIVFTRTTLFTVRYFVNEHEPVSIDYEPETSAPSQFIISSIADDQILITIPDRQNGVLVQLADTGEATTRANFGFIEMLRVMASLDRDLFHEHFNVISAMLSPTLMRIIFNAEQYAGGDEPGATATVVGSSEIIAPVLPLMTTHAQRMIGARFYSPITTHEDNDSRARGVTVSLNSYFSYSPPFLMARVYSVSPGDCRDFEYRWYDRWRFDVRGLETDFYRVFSGSRFDDVSRLDFGGCSNRFLGNSPEINHLSVRVRILDSDVASRRFEGRLRDTVLAAADINQLTEVAQSQILIVGELTGDSERQVPAVSEGSEDHFDNFLVQLHPEMMRARLQSMLRSDINTDAIPYFRYFMDNITNYYFTSQYAVNRRQRESDEAARVRLTSRSAAVAAFMMCLLYAVNPSEARVESDEAASEPLATGNAAAGAFMMCLLYGASPSKAR